MAGNLSIEKKNSNSKEFVFHRRNSIDKHSLRMSKFNVVSASSYTPKER